MPPHCGKTWRRWMKEEKERRLTQASVVTAISTKAWGDGDAGGKRPNAGWCTAEREGEKRKGEGGEEKVKNIMHTKTPKHKRKDCYLSSQTRHGPAHLKPNTDQNPARSETDWTRAWTDLKDFILDSPERRVIKHKFVECLYKATFKQVTGCMFG